MKAHMKAATKYLLPPVTVVLILFLVFIVKGIYPFGENTIVYYDMGQQVVPFYYHIYDSLHGGSALFFDWYSNLSANYTMGMANSGCFSPMILFFYFVPRSMIMESLSLLLVLKTGLMALSMYFFLSKGFCRKADYLWRYLFSIVYGLCGYALLYYTMLTWFDMMIFVPLLALAVWELLRDGKNIGYVCLLALCMINNYYLTIMVLLYIFLVAGTWLLFWVEKAQRGFLVRKLGFGTIGGIGLSLFVLLPALFHTMSSKRFSESMDLLSILQSAGADQYYMKYWMLLGLMLPIAVLVWKMLPVLFSKKKEPLEKKKAWLIVCMILYVLLLVPFENINLIWSFGSYVQYPLRCGFLIAFAILSAACYYAPKGESRDRPFWYKGAFSAVVAILFFFALVHFYRKVNVYQAESLFGISIIYSIILFFLYSAILVFRKQGRHIFSLCLLILIETEMLFGVYVFIGTPAFVTGFAEGPEQQGDYVSAALQIKEEARVQDSVVSRIKNPDTSLNANYPIIMRRSAVSGWTTAIDENFQNAAAIWGYSTHFTRVLDAGGTVFSDALMAVTETVSCLHQNPELYQEKALSGEYTVYDNRFTLPFGLVLNHETAEKLAEIEGKDWIYVQNLFYQGLSGDSKDLIEKRELKGSENKIFIEGKKILYLKPSESVAVQVNGEQLFVPTIGDMENEEYPAEFNNGLQLLGVFENEQVSVVLNSTTGKSASAVLGLLDYNLLDSLCKQLSPSVQTEQVTGSRLELNLLADTEEADVLLLPLSYHSGWQAYADGKRVSAESCGGLFTRIELPKGAEQLELKYVPDGFYSGLLLSLLTGVLLLVLWFVSKKSKQNEALKKVWRTVDGILLYIYTAVFYIGVCCIYVVPIAYFVYGFIQRRL